MHNFDHSSKEALQLCSCLYMWSIETYEKPVGLGGLEVPCSPRDPRFAGSNPAKVDGFFSGLKNPEHKSSGRDF